jgi:hypothetical protein
MALTAASATEVEGMSGSLDWIVSDAAFSTCWVVGRNRTSTEA